MISGTSFDAIEVVAAEFTLEGDTVRARVLAHESVDFEASLRARVAAVLPPATTTIDEVARLDTSLGHAFAAAAVAMSEVVGELDVVCSHGQTVFHWVEGGHALGTLQIGQAAWIAEATGATVVADVRARDVAAGGQGAPLVSLLDVLVLGRHPSQVRAALNLGGISNATVVSPDAEPLAYDIGPANALMDAAVTWRSGGAETFDRDGARGARGRVDEDLLASLLAEPYYREPAPKSTGKELFHLDYLRGHLERVGASGIGDDDLVATLTELTARTVADALRAHGVVEVFASGGGTRNPTLMAALARHLEGVSLRTTDALGVPEAAKEALLFALIGFLSVHGLAGSVPSCTGARASRVLGAITPGRTPLVSLPASAAPTRLVVERGGDA